MPEIVWTPTGPSNHTIPEEWKDLPQLTIAWCDCGRLIIHTVDDYGQPRWKHLTKIEIWFYRLFGPERIGLTTRHTPIIGRGDK